MTTSLSIQYSFYHDLSAVHISPLNTGMQIHLLIVCYTNNISTYCLLLAVKRLGGEAEVEEEAKVEEEAEVEEEEEEVWVMEDADMEEDRNEADTVHIIIVIIIIINLLCVC